MNEENNKKVFQCICGKQFETEKLLAKHQARCKTFINSKRLPNGMFKCENPDCGKEHDGSYGTGRFCCEKCRRHYASLKSAQTAIKNGNKHCPENFKNFKNFKIPRAEYGRWKCERCNLIFETRSQLKKHNHEFHPIPKGQPWNKGLTKKMDKRVANAAKTLSTNYKSGKIMHPLKGKHHSDAEKEKTRISTFKYLQKTKNISQPRYNVNSISFFDNLSKEKGWNLQHAENGGEITVLGYWLDAYDKERNIVVEYDEPAHYEDIENNILCEKDSKRQQEIIDYLHCEFWRYNESMDLLYKIII